MSYQIRKDKTWKQILKLINRKIMKTQSQNLFKEINKTTASQENLVKETGIQSKTFSAADMWNIHRQRKTTVIR